MPAVPAAPTAIAAELHANARVVGHFDGIVAVATMEEYEWSSNLRPQGPRCGGARRSCASSKHSIRIRALKSVRPLRHFHRSSHVMLPQNRASSFNLRAPPERSTSTLASVRRGRPRLSHADGFPTSSPVGARVTNPSCRSAFARGGSKVALLSCCAGFPWNNGKRTCSRTGTAPAFPLSVSRTNAKALIAEALIPLDAAFPGTAITPAFRCCAGTLAAARAANPRGIRLAQCRTAVLML